MKNHLQIFDEARPQLFAIAYRMLGTVMEAEDMLQEAFLRWQRAAAEEIASPKAYLSTIITRLCIDHLRSAQVQREDYIGPWLPEPLVTDVSAMPHGALALTESLSMAFLVILESLKPVERAVFLLREVFDYEYVEIAEMVGKSEVHCRQLVSRARRYVAERRPRFEVPLEQQQQAVDQFMQALSGGDVEGLLTVLAEDVVWTSDGGGMRGIAQKPIYGAEKVARFALNFRRVAPENVATRLLEINGRPGIATYIDGQPFSVFAFDVVEGRIVVIRAMVNPAKLTTIPALD